MRNDLDQDALERRLEDYYDHASRPPTPKTTWAKVAARLEEEPLEMSSQAGLYPQPATSQRTRRPRALPAAGAIVAALLLIALAGALFAELGGRRTSQTNPAATPRIKATATATAKDDIPAGAYLYTMTMTSPDSGWAAGYVDGAGLILQYSDSHWHVAASGFTGYALDTIVMASPNEGWAEGRPIEGGTRLLLLHYAGGHWSQMTLPSQPPAQTARGQLAMHQGSGWVVVYLRTDERKNDIFGLYHYAHGAWSEIPVPAGITIFGSDITPSRDSGVISLGQDDAWVVASKYPNGVDYFVAHYHAGTWTTWPLQTGWSVGQILMASPTDGWAIGGVRGPNNVDSDAELLLLHFNGHTWTRVALPSEPGAQYSSYKYGFLTAPGEAWAFRKVRPSHLPSPAASVVWSTSGAYQFRQGEFHQTAWPYTGDASLGVATVTQVAPNDYWFLAYYEYQTTDRKGYVILHYVNGVWSAHGGS